MYFMNILQICSEYYFLFFEYNFHTLLTYTLILNGTGILLPAWSSICYNGAKNMSFFKVQVL